MRGHSLRTKGEKDRSSPGEGGNDEELPYEVDSGTSGSR